MRSLSRNQKTLYYTRASSTTEAIDSFGNHTGELKVNYASPVSVKLCVMPSNGAVVQDLKGELLTTDLVATVVGSPLLMGDLLFNVSPTGNYASTYDYSVKRIMQSPNSTMYILAVRK